MIFSKLTDTRIPVSGKRPIFFAILCLTIAGTFAAGPVRATSLPDQCIYTLNRSAPGALMVQPGAALNMPACGVVVDSSNPAALGVGDGASLQAKYIDVVGGYNSGAQATFSATPQTGVTYQPDPLSFITVPAAAKCDYTNVSFSSGTASLKPGTYCNGIAVSGTANVTLAPGTYVMMGGGLRASGSSHLQGHGTIVFTQGLGYSYAPLTVSDSAVLSLQALKGGDYPGVLFLQDPRVGTAAKPVIINGSRTSKLEGILYFPTSAVSWSGVASGSQGAYFAIIADTVNVTGSATIDSNYGSLQHWLELGSLLMGLQGGSAAPQTSTPSARISGSIGSSGKTFSLAGNVSPRIASATDLGDASSSVVFPRIVMHLAMTTAQQADLQQLLSALQDKTSPQYHKWLTPEQFAARFGAAASDISRITAWLQAQGFTDVQVARGHTFVSMTGTAAQIRAAFQTPVHKYQLNGETHYANASDPVLPQALQGLVSGIRGLNDFHPRPHARTIVQSRFTSSISGNHFMAPEDFQIIYNVTPLLQSGINGSGQTIAIIGQSDVMNSDIQAFEAAGGLAANLPNVILDGTDPGQQISSGDMSESDLDIEWADAVAPYATIDFVISTDAFTSLTYAIDNNYGSVVSISYGACEAEEGAATINSLNTMFQQANTQGQTIVAPAGDTGAADCDSGTATVAHLGLAVDFPGSSPYVTSAGGTEFNEGTGTYWNSTNDANMGSATGYIPEMVWNDTASTGELAATGGGASSYFSKPSWQTGTGVPADGQRDTPDIAFNTSPNHDGYLVCTDGSCVNGFRAADQTLQVYGGTSLATPTFAAIVLLIDQQMNGRQGNVNPTLYSLASIAPDAFHDIITGSNIVPCRGGSLNCSSQTLGVNGTMGYSAGVGYDQASGLGSINAYNLASQWNSGFTLSVSPSTTTIAYGGTGTATVTITAVSGFSGIVQLSCSVPSTLTNTTCSIPSSISGAGTATLTITNSGASAHLLPFPPGPLFWPGIGVLAFGTTLLFVSRKRGRLAAVGVVLLAGVMVGCGGGNSGGSTSSISAGTGTTGTGSTQPTPVTANVTVTAKSGSITETANVAVTIP